VGAGRKGVLVYVCKTSRACGTKKDGDHRCISVNQRAGLVAPGLALRVAQPSGPAILHAQSQNSTTLLHRA